ncbi:hypothetical protein ACHAXR_010695 [Thalassiosira sp. AJA248-18]
MDVEFDKVKEECPGIDFNLPGAREHVATQGISERYSPREIVTGRSLVYGKSIPNIKIGTYVEASHDAVITNNNVLRTFAAIYLGPVGNIQGIYKVFDLKKGVVKKSRTVTEFPMPDNVIKLVNAWGKRYQKTTSKSLMTFRNRNKQPFDWENDELNDADDVIEVTRADESVSANFPGIQLERESDVDTSAAVEAVLPPSMEEEAQAAAPNSGVVNRANTPIPGVSSAVVEEIKEDDDANANGGSQEWTGKLESFPKVEDVEEDDDDDDDDTLEPETLESLEDEDDDESDILPELTPRNRKKPVYYEVNFKNKVYDKVTEGVINFNMDEQHLRPFTNEDALLHVLGVIMVQNFSLKKGLKHFGKALTVGSQVVNHPSGAINPLDFGKEVGRGAVMEVARARGGEVAFGRRSTPLGQRAMTNENGAIKAEAKKQWEYWQRPLLDNKQAAAIGTTTNGNSRNGGATMLHMEDGESREITLAQCASRGGEVTATMEHTHPKPRPMESATMLHLEDGKSGENKLAQCASRGGEVTATMEQTHPDPHPMEMEASTLTGRRPLAESGGANATWEKAETTLVVDPSLDANDPTGPTAMAQCARLSVQSQCDLTDGGDHRLLEGLKPPLLNRGQPVTGASKERHRIENKERRINKQLSQGAFNRPIKQLR